MKLFSKFNKGNKNFNIYYKDFVRIIFFGSLIIIVAVFITGLLSFFLSKQEAIKKLKSKDLVYILESMTSKIDGNMQRARETSLILAEDPVIIQWLKNEKDEQLRQYAINQIKNISKNYDYSNSFIVSNLTKHYWDENGNILNTLFEMQPYDAWFFETIKANIPVSFSIDYNDLRNDTFVFVNAIIYDNNAPIGVTGVALSLKDIAIEFQNYKIGKESNLWLIDNKGIIKLSDKISNNGKNIDEFIPLNLSRNIIDNKDKSTKDEISEYKNKDGKLYDITYKNIKFTNWTLVFQEPREESLTIVNSIKNNTIITCLITIFFIIIMFYFISRKIFNPFNRTLLANKQLEETVTKRTKELTEKNTEIMDSIHYASMIQNSILPPEEEFIKTFNEFFIFWKPKDIVGGDFYWLKKVGNVCILAVADCTGHGIPGAFMTMLASSTLNDIVEHMEDINPSQILKQLNYNIKKILNKESEKYISDDGLDIAICCIKENSKMIFAGAKMSLYIKNNEEVKIINGNKKSIGYKNVDNNYEFNNNFIDINIGDIYYLTTDGYIHQDGGAKNLPMGKKRFISFIENLYNIPLKDQKKFFQDELFCYMNEEPQLDDITVVGFKIINERM